MANKNIISELKQLIADNKLKRVIERLVKLSDENSIILCSARLKDIEGKYNIGIIKFEEYTLEVSKIRNTLLNIADNLRAENKNNIEESQYPMDRIKELLKKPEEWIKDLGNKKYSYHKLFSEFRIEFSELEEIQEVYSFFYTNHKSYLGEAVFKYHSTTLFELEYLTVDEMRIYIGGPKFRNVNYKHFNNWYLYYDLSDLDGIFHYFLTDGRIEQSARGDKCQFLFFNDKEEQKNYDSFLLQNMEKLISLEPDFTATYAVRRIKEHNFPSTVDPIFINKTRKLYEEWRRKF